MLKVLGTLALGVFVGAMSVEILKQKRPGLLQDIERKAEQTARSFIEAFQQGYSGTT